MLMYYILRLVWEEGKASNYWSAKSINGYYDVILEGKKYYMYCPGDWRYPCKSFDDGKNKAEKHHKKQMEKFLEKVNV